MRLARVAVALVVSVAVARPAAAQLLTFDDVPSSGNPNGTVYLSTVYKGYTFGGTTTSAGQCGLPTQCDWVTNLDFWQSQFPAPVSSPVLLWSAAEPTLTLSRSTAFNFTSAQLGAAYGVCAIGQTPNMTVNGYRAGALVNTAVVDLTCGGFAKETFDWMNVDMVEFQATDVLANRLFDDIEVSDAATTTPEPATIALLGGGLLALGAVVRRRRSVS